MAPGNVGVEPGNEGGSLGKPEGFVRRDMPGKVSDAARCVSRGDGRCAGGQPEGMPGGAGAAHERALGTVARVAGLPRIAVLASGEGTNLQALIDRIHGQAVEIVAVSGDKPGARALERAAAAGIATQVFPRDDYADRPARDAAIATWLRSVGAETIVLAGYMALLTPGFIAAFPDRIVNVHPSLLPKFPGLRAIEQALEAEAASTGVTVHLVDDGIDTGPVLLQREVLIPDGADAAAVRALLAPVEHELLCEAVVGVATGRT